MSKKNYTVGPNGKGGWSVKGDGNKNASSNHSLKKDAIQAGKSVAKKAGGELTIKNKDGKIADLWQRPSSTKGLNNIRG